MRLSERGNLQVLFISQFPETLAQIRDIKYIRNFLTFARRIPFKYVYVRISVHVHTDVLDYATAHSSRMYPFRSVKAEGAARDRSFFI